MPWGRWRYGLSVPFAGGVTLSLGLIMQSVVAVEFVPQPTDRASTTIATYICEEVVICGGYWEDDRLDSFPLLPTIPPTSPYAPHRDPHPKWTNPAPYVLVELGFDPSLYKPRVELPRAVPYPRMVDDAHGHTRRMPPQFPSRFLQGDHSGYCRMRFDVRENGRATNIEATVCTDEILRKSSIESVKRWQYNPASPARSGVKTTIRFILKDENGELLPLPDGF